MFVAVFFTYREKANFDHARSVNELLVQGGIDRRPVTVEEMKAIEPTLHSALYGGFYTPSDSTGDIYKYTIGLARACEKRSARFYYDADVRRIERQESFRVFYASGTEDRNSGQHDIRADAIVICAGCRSRDFAARLGDRLNIYPVKGYSIMVELDESASQEAAPWVSLLDDRARSLRAD